MTLTVWSIIRFIYRMYIEMVFVSNLNAYEYVDTLLNW